ncbi:retinitis pigmentosa 1-like 1 protein isoform X2 [Pseudomyrmex gracilis]|uniref:retinitis pigmentosa 1-like 1 protein isoform X2 n=1 Tax=Pseudomyrmex gracilis TaxID=219809 RepID=UPI000994F977|nr:retinitis pigmentosa 1-like 1 protein isoform X2 [Pseudomyrmex gracilis]
MPYVAHKRLVTIVHSPIHHVYYAGTVVPIRVRARVRPSILAAEFSRIRDLPRPTSRSYLEEYLNSRPNIFFDDEAREIRARVDSLLRRVHVFVPRALASDFVEEIVPERMRSHDYVRRLLTGRNNAKKEVDSYLSWYEVPDRANIGTLACVKYVAGKPQSVRKPYFKVADLRPADIRNDVNFLSYYLKNRQAAATASRALAIEPTTQAQNPTFASEPEIKLEKKEKKKPESTKESKPESKLASKSVKELESESIAQPIAEPASVKLSKSTKSSKAMKAMSVAKPAELAKESEPEQVKELELVKELEPIKELEAVKELEPESIKESEPELEVVKEPELAKKLEPESVKESEPELKVMKEPELTKEHEASTEPAPADNAEAVSDNTKENQKVKKEREDAIKRAEEYLAKVVREAQSEEERRKVAEEEHLQLETEERKAWEALQLAQERKAEFCQILEIEQQEAERKAEEAKLENERKEAEKIEEGERLANQIKLDALIKEQEILIVEEHLEEVQHQKQEQEEVDVLQLQESELRDISCAEDPADLGEVTDQENEERPCDIIIDDETRVKEKNVCEKEHVDVREDPFIEEPEGPESKSQTEPITAEDGPQIEEVLSGGDKFEWDNQDL